MAAQETSTHPPPDDPIVYQLFFGFHDSVSAIIQSKKALNLENGTKVEKGFAGKLRIKQGDISIVTAVSHQFVLDLAALQNELQANVEKARSQKQEPDLSLLQQFDQRKQRLIDQAVQQIRVTLPPESWAGLHAYINDEHRLHTSVVQVKTAPVTGRP